MVNELAGRIAAVFIDNGECRAVDDILDAQLLANRLKANTVRSSIEAINALAVSCIFSRLSILKVLIG